MSNNFKVKFSISCFLLILPSTNLFSQITIGKVERQLDTTVLRPPAYDSLKNFECYESYFQHTYNEDRMSSFIFYKQYIGLKIYFPPSCDNYPELKNRSVCDKYFTIINNKTYKNWPTDKDSILLKDDITGRLLSCEAGSIYSVAILVPYFVKQQQLCNKKNFIYMGGSPNNPIEHTDLKTRKTIFVQHLSKWSCEVTLLKRNQVFDYERAYAHEPSAEGYEIYYIMTNDKGETMALTSIDGSNDLTFKAESAYKKEEKEKMLKEADRIAKLKLEEKIRLEKEKKEKEKYRNECISKFGQYNGELIAQGKVKIGMTTEMCKASWGLPYRTDRTTTEDAIMENWYYGYSHSLHFNNGVLIRIEE